MTTHMEVTRWGEQARAEAVRWHQDVNGVAKQRLVDFEAGFEQGWRAAVTALQAHKVCKLTETREEAARA